MTRQDYERLVQQIEALYQARVDEYAKEMESEKEKDLAAVDRIWRLENDQDPPPLTARRRSVKVTTNGHKPTSQKQRIRKVIDRLLGPVDSAQVMKTFGQVFPDEDQPESSTISKVFREMVKEEKLECTKQAGFQQPAVYTKK